VALFSLSLARADILDIKPVNMEELTEVITAAEFHPVSCNLFCYSSSKGTVKLADMREQALCDKHAKRKLPLCGGWCRCLRKRQGADDDERTLVVYEEEEDPSNKSFFSEIISSVSDVKFSKDGRYILSRDYLTLRIWDINMESKPIQTINVHDHLRSKLCDLYENDCIFDKFECTFSGNGERVFLLLTLQLELTCFFFRAGTSSQDRTTTTSTSTIAKRQPTSYSRRTSRRSRRRR
jgi:serine/threonine-protein phosphatase 2A regulatory subunit B